MPNTQALHDLILSKAKPTWQSGETDWLWQDDKGRGMFLADGSVGVSLHITGYKHYLPIWFNFDRWVVAAHFNVRELDAFAKLYNDIVSQTSYIPKLADDGMSFIERGALRCRAIKAIVSK